MSFKNFLSFTLLICGSVLMGTQAEAEDVWVVTQDYKIFKTQRDGLDAKDIEQKMTFAEDVLRIDEFAKGGDQPTETYIVNFKGQEIINIDHNSYTFTKESFAERRQKIDRNKDNIQRRIKAMPNSKQKEDIKRLYRALLDDDRNLKMVKNPEKEEIAGVKTERFAIQDSKDKDFAGIKASLHPTISLPYDNAEALYLLRLIGGKMRDFLNEKDNQKTFRQLPMKLDLQLAAGGYLKTQVNKIEASQREKLDPNFFEIPKEYKPKPKKRKGAPKPVDPD